MTIGQHLKTLRSEQNRTLHQVAVGTDIDATLLSKIERGERLPTDNQLISLAHFFNIAFKTLQIEAIADKIIKDYGLNATTMQAIHLVQTQFIPNLNDTKK
jgi:transcriptional regulator with XRE-family HTH domain